MELRNTCGIPGVGNCAVKGHSMSSTFVWRLQTDHYGILVMATANVDGIVHVSCSVDIGIASRTYSIHKLYIFLSYGTYV